MRDTRTFARRDFSGFGAVIKIMVPYVSLSADNVLVFPLSPASAMSYKRLPLVFLVLAAGVAGLAGCGRIADKDLIVVARIGDE